MEPESHCQRFVQQVIERLIVLKTSSGACQHVMDLLIESGVHRRLKLRPRKS